MVKGEGIEVTASQLAPAEPVYTDADERFIHFQGENLPRGTVINIHLSHLSEGGGAFFTILWVIIAVVIMGVAVYLLRRSKGEKPVE
jgi:hypothetical protein